MLKSSEPISILTIKVRVRPDAKRAFADWQAEVNSVLAAFPGFVSLEILSPSEIQPDWMIMQRFHSSQDAATWRASNVHQELITKLNTLKLAGSEVNESEAEISQLRGGVTEVFITQVNPHKEQLFREWTAKVHQIEAKFPGFRGVYIQSPTSRQGKNWITLLQFDTTENLDRWLESPERHEMLKESESIAAIESHRVISAYGGWFSSIAKKGEVPPAWKQTMIVLLVLFPIVMLEIRYLNPWTAAYGPVLSTFIGNALSVALISWPAVPIAILFLGWWLSPDGAQRAKTWVGTIIVLILYLIEIAIFSYF